MLLTNSYNYFYKTATKTSINSYWYNWLLNSNSNVNFFFNSIPGTVVRKYSLEAKANNFNIYFIKKELFYTKLKYSRVPQFDTASGAVGSFLSGLYGFMVCEKFGFELIDSGDFIFLTIYLLLLGLTASKFITFLNTPNSLITSLNTFICSFK